MYDNIFSVITIKEKQTRFKNETSLANLFRTGDFEHTHNKPNNGAGVGDHTDLQYCLKSDILIPVFRVYQGGQEEPNTR